MRSGLMDTTRVRRQLLTLESLRVLVNIEICVHTECHGVQVRRLFVTEPDSFGCNWQIEWPIVHGHGGALSHPASRGHRANPGALQRGALSGRSDQAPVRGESIYQQALRQCVKEQDRNERQATVASLVLAARTACHAVLSPAGVWASGVATEGPRLCAMSSRARVHSGRNGPSDRLRYTWACHLPVSLEP